MSLYRGGEDQRIAQFNGIATERGQFRYEFGDAANRSIVIRVQIELKLWTLGAHEPNILDVSVPYSTSVWAADY